MNKLRKEGFTMIELLVVLVIIAILAAVAAPLYLANTKKAKAAEAVATMALMRQALRDYKISHNGYFTNTNPGAGAQGGIIQHVLPTSVAGTTPSPLTAGLDVDAGAAQYFSNSAFTFTAESVIAFTDPSIVGQPATPVDFLIKVDGSKSENTGCTNYKPLDNCATKKGEVSTYKLEMDNSGRTFVSYDGSTWQLY